MNKRFILIAILLIILFVIGTITFTQFSSKSVPENLSQEIASSTSATTTPETGTQPQPTPTNYIINNSHNNKTVTLKVGDEFLIALDPSIDWKFEFSKPGIVEQVKTTDVLQGTQGIYKAQKTGQTTLTAGGGKKCAPGEACILIYATFSTTIIVEQ